MLDVEHDELRNIVGVLALEHFFNLGKVGLDCLDREREFIVVVNLLLPSVNAVDLRYLY